MTRRFDRVELAFFAVPRAWREIEMRFGLEAKTEPFRDCIILADNEGGSGDLKYLRPSKSWVLTDVGKARVGERLIARELRVYPDRRRLEEEQKEAGDAFNEAFERENPFAEFLEKQGPVEAGAIVIDAEPSIEQRASTKVHEDMHRNELEKLIAEQEADGD